MKRIIPFLFLLQCICSLRVAAQNYGNEWINYSQSYYKFSIFKDGLYRIPVSNLLALGLPSTINGSQLQMFRDGKEVTLFVTNAGTLNGTDYIEFYGEKANGDLDKELYLNPAFQLNPQLNLTSDTAYYFITYNTSSNNKRFAVLANNLSSPPLKETYYWEKVKNNYRSVFSNGPSYFGQYENPVLYLNSSQYEDGEGYVKSFTTSADSMVYTLTNPYTVSGGPNAYFKTTVSGFSYLTQHRVKIAANNNILADSTFSSFGYKRYNIAVPMAYLTAQNKLSMKYTSHNSIPSQNLFDRFGIASAELRYPRLFNFDNKTEYYFELDPKASDYFLEISNFNNGNISPRLLDLSSSEYIIGDISVPNMVRFRIPASTDVKRLYLRSLAASTFENVSGLKPVTFKNYTLASNQGDYILLTHPGYANDGTNYLTDYKNYRSSLSGGSYQVVTALVDEIYDEFGYGYQYSPLAIRNFFKFAVKNNQWSNKPKFAFIIGKGINYKDYLTYSQSPASSYPFYAIPSFGEPCSDVLLTDFDKNNKVQLPVGRLPIMNTYEIGDYLNKVKDHEQRIASTSWQLSDSLLWQKRVLHLAGTKIAAEQAPILNYLNNQSNLLGRSFFGAKVTTLKKGSTSEVEEINSSQVDQMFNSGVGIIQFFGHSSASGMDYNLDYPEKYTNYGKYPLFIANGCGAGNAFILTGQKSLGEKFVMIPNKGVIAFLASVNTGLSDNLGTYTDSLYRKIGLNEYGQALGIQVNQNVNTLINVFPNYSLLRLHTEQIFLNGDPAIKTYHYPKADYAVEEKGVSFKQQNLTTSIDSLDVDIAIHNLGKFTGDSVSLLVKRKLPNGVEYVLMNKKIGGLSYSDTLSFKIPTLGDAALGVNTLEISLDEESVLDEVSESNNEIKRPFTIYNDDLVPVFPYNFSIVSNQGVMLKASTLNPFSQLRKYVLQIDTTEKFNSPLLLTQRIDSKGGVVRWQPSLTLRDSTVYYWRTAMDTLYGNTLHRWSTSSFIYLDQSMPGWNQSHYFQYTKNNYNSIDLDSASRRFEFFDLNKKLQVQNVCMYAPPPYQYDWPEYIVKLSGATLYNFGCDPWPGYSSLQFVVIDSLTGMPWINTKHPTLNEGRFGSFAPCRIDEPNYQDPFFEFSFTNATGRKKIMDFMDSIPQGTYMMIQPRLCVSPSSPSSLNVCGSRNVIFVRHWKADTTTLGSNNSLYHKMYDMGFTLIDSFYKNRPMVFWTRKGMPNTVQQFVEADSTKKLYAEFDFKSYIYEGEINSTIIGPASVWSQFKRRTSSNDPGAGDSVAFVIKGITVDNQSQLLATVVGDTSLTFIDAKQYPKLQISMVNSDNIYTSPAELKYWRVHYQPVPEAALNPNRHFVFTDTVGQGQKMKVGLAIENLTEIPMDSILVKYEVIDASNNRIPLGVKRYKPLPILDTILTEFDVSSAGLNGNNTFYVEVNPDNDQLEQFHPNNIGFKPFYVVSDNKNPLIDVTFDGIHIMDKDIVSSKPFIHITLKDENKYLALDDTSLIQVYMRYPGDNVTSETYIPFDGNTLKFFPAEGSQLGSKNTASIEYRPEFTKDGNDYMLIVRAKDKSGNTTGQQSYKVGFEVNTKPAISSVLNYPNPFTTSTQFVFTLTGSEIPHQFKIQIMTPTGKVVREILKSELGPLHIGRNITEYKWKGDDQYGQPLGNGVYLYRVVTALNGTKMDHHTTDADKWIDKGFGKLYIMR